MTTTSIDLSNSKILIVDDTPENLKVLRQTLEIQSYSILVATSGEACITVATRAIPDLILLDVMMPGINGFETCRRLKSDHTTHEIPIIFIPVNCSAIPSELAESTLFGHIKGAFTGADRDRTGYFELADGGTLFLDEIGDMPLDLQTKMLRVLDDERILPVGSTTEKQLDVRILAATNANLETDINTGKFRQDLYFRLNRFPVQLPPLRERREDISILTQHFLHLFASEMGIHAPDIHSDAYGVLQTYHFPGNVRELKNIIGRAVIESNGQTIHPHHLHLLQFSPDTPTTPATPSDTPLPLNLKQAEEMLIQRALEQTDGNIAATARLLGTNRPHIYKFLEEKNKGAGEQGSKGAEEI